MNLNNDNSSNSHVTYQKDSINSEKSKELNFTNISYDIVNKSNEYKSNEYKSNEYKSNEYKSNEYNSSNTNSSVSSYSKSLKLNEINRKIQEFHNKIEIFFEKDIWEIKNISNYKLKKILDNIYKLKKKISNKKIFNIDLFYHLEINDPKLINKEINKEISKIKKDNTYLFKTHSELFYQYHQLYYEIILLKKQIKFTPNIIDTSKIIKNNDQLKYSTNNKIDLHDKKIIDNFMYCLKLDNINEILKKLEENIYKTKSNFNSIDFNIINDIILFDCENLLKSFWIQNIFKKILSESEYYKYFDTWINGYTTHTDIINESMSMSEFSQTTKYIEPFTSLNINLTDKIKLINLLITNYFSSYFCICIFNSKNETFVNHIDNYIFYININYKKNDIREQDDHLILYLYYYFKKINKNIFILSNDYFKYFSYDDIKLDLKEIKILYDYDANNTRYVVSNSKNDLILINNKFYQLYINNIIPIDISENVAEKEIVFYKKKLFDIIKKILNSNLLENDLEELINISSYLKLEIKNINIFFDEIFNFIESKTKKEIFKIMLSNFTNNNNIFSDDFQNTFTNKLNIFIQIIDLFLVIKFIKLNYIEDSFLKLYIDIFELIVYLFDKIEDSIDKIRKLSHNNNKLKIFNKLNSLYLYFKKIGFFKKIH